MTDTENEQGDPRWRSAETLQELFDHMDEFRRSPQGQQLQAARQAAEADLQTWLADQPGVVVGRHGGLVPEQWGGEVDGHSFYFRERGGDWDIELDLHEQRPGLTRGDPIATGTITAPGYGESLRERAAFIVTTIRNHLRHTRTAEAAARPDFAFRVEWLQADNEFVGLVAEFPSLSWLAPTEDEALRGIIKVVEQIVADDPDTGGGGLR
jgi:predicted RNase H-like HicB family nuclease